MQPPHPETCSTLLRLSLSYNGLKLLISHRRGLFSVCIERKNARESKDVVREEPAEEPPNDDTDDEDIFFDCDADGPEPIPEWSKEPVGRLKKLGKLKLLHHDENIYVPICQDPTPLTEDMLAEQAEVLLQVGTYSLENMKFVCLHLHF